MLRAYFNGLSDTEKSEIRTKAHDATLALNLKPETLGFGKMVETKIRMLTREHRKEYAETLST